MKKDCINNISNFISHKVTKDIYIPVKTLKENAFPEGGRGEGYIFLNGLFLSLSKLAFSLKCSNIILFSKKAEEITKKLIGKKVPIFLESALSKFHCGFRKGFITHCYFLQITLFK